MKDQYKISKFNEKLLDKHTICWTTITCRGYHWSKVIMGNWLSLLLKHCIKSGVTWKLKYMQPTRKCVSEWSNKVFAQNYTLDTPATHANSNQLNWSDCVKPIKSTFQSMTRMINDHVPVVDLECQRRCRGEQSWTGVFSTTQISTLDNMTKTTSGSVPASSSRIMLKRSRASGTP